MLLGWEGDGEGLERVWLVCSNSVRVCFGVICFRDDEGGVGVVVVVDWQLIVGITHQYRGNPNIIVNSIVPKVPTYTTKAPKLPKTYPTLHNASPFLTNFSGTVHGDNSNNLNGLSGKLGKAKTTKID